MEIRIECTQTETPNYDYIDDGWKITGTSVSQDEVIIRDSQDPNCYPLGYGLWTNWSDNDVNCSKEDLIRLANSILEYFSEE